MSSSWRGDPILCDDSGCNLASADLSVTLAHIRLLRATHDWIPVVHDCDSVAHDWRSDMHD